MRVFMASLGDLKAALREYDLKKIAIQKEKTRENVEGSGKKRKRTNDGVVLIIPMTTSELSLICYQYQCMSLVSITSNCHSLWMVKIMIIRSHG